jgi:hypothetical protein
MDAEIAKPEDFRHLTQGRDSERVVLPKLGKTVLLRRPSPMWFLFRGQLPASLVIGLQNSKPGVDSVEDLRALSEWMLAILQEVFVEPRLSMAPGPEEISPEWLDVEDANFVVRWAVGEVTGDGHDLADFCGKPAPAPPGAGGGNVALSSE